MVPRLTQIHYAALFAGFGLASIVTLALSKSLLWTAVANVFAAGIVLVTYQEVQARDLDTKADILGFVLDFETPTTLWAALAGVTVGVGVGIRLFAGLLREILAPNQPVAGHSITTQPAPDPLAVLGIALAVVVLGPLAEEVVFRGLLQRLLARRVGLGVAIGLTAVVFAAFHIPNYGGRQPLARLAIPLSVLTLDAILWGALYAGSGTLTVPWLAHAGSNAVALVLWVT